MGRHWKNNFKILKAKSVCHQRAKYHKIKTKLFQTFYIVKELLIELQHAKSKVKGEVYRRVSGRKRKGNVIRTSKSKRNNKEIKGII